MTYAAPPPGSADDSRVGDAWHDTYNDYIGPLHRIKFLRILLDGKYTSHIRAVDLGKTNLYIYRGAYYQKLCVQDINGCPGTHWALQMDSQWNPHTQVSGRVFMRILALLFGSNPWPLEIVLTGSSCLEEFYSYFDFLGVRHTGRYEDFENNYINVSKEYLSAMVINIQNRTRMLGSASPTSSGPSSSAELMLADFSPCQLSNCRTSVNALSRLHFVMSNT